MDSGTNTAGGIDFTVSNTFFKSGRVQRVIDTESGQISASKILFILTDGGSDNYDGTIQAAKNAKNKSISIYSIGVGKSINK
jgi:hypothetical protein